MNLFNIIKNVLLWVSGNERSALFFPSNDAGASARVYRCIGHNMYKIRKNYVIRKNFVDPTEK
uniref:Uncharacterized protein n=1 Tax=Romanomermis culicivorax TaxID=13658 RepID=A0A915JYU9_ROMCU